MCFDLKPYTLLLWYHTTPQAAHGGLAESPVPNRQLELAPSATSPISDGLASQARTPIKDCNLESRSCMVLSQSFSCESSSPLRLDLDALPVSQDPGVCSGTARLNHVSIYTEGVWDNNSPHHSGWISLRSSRLPRCPKGQTKDHPFVLEYLKGTAYELMKDAELKWVFPKTLTCQ